MGEVSTPLAGGGRGGGIYCWQAIHSAGKLCIMLYIPPPPPPPSDRAARAVPRDVPPRVPRVQPRVQHGVRGVLGGPREPVLGLASHASFPPALAHSSADYCHLHPAEVSNCHLLCTVIAASCIPNTGCPLKIYSFIINPNGPRTCSS